MYQLSDVPVKEHCIKATLRACPNLYSWSDEGCKPSENVPRTSKSLIGSEINVEEFVFVSVKL